jgi:hypothetical protein
MSDLFPLDQLVCPKSGDNLIDLLFILLRPAQEFLVNGCKI